MVSGAGHDAMEFAKKFPTGLIFIPSKDGISHNKEEYSFDNDIITGTEVLLDSILCIDKINFNFNLI
jgi:acetylornithine deacetylase/succinyl-diaminopimelate desuccinylase-like protein